MAPHRATLVLGLALLAHASSLATRASQGPTIDVGYATFLGNTSIPDVDFFGNIRYVQPPLGDLRWRAPVPLDETATTSKNVTDARNFGEICLQQPAQIGFGSDDCLTLNVWKPAGAKAGDNLPVVIYIHGGGNYYASAQGFPMGTWVQQSKGTIVAVNIQYRLGLLGYLASEAVMENGDVNVGLLDQRAAIAWVKKHIHSFGGDGGHITLAGQSAGSSDIVYHMVAYAGQGEPDFQGVIVQSIGTDPVPLPEKYEMCFANVTATVGCSNQTSNADIMSCLRAAPLSALATAIDNKPSVCKYLPVIDGTLIPDYPSRLIARGAFHKVNFIGGHVTDDGSIFVGNPDVFVNTTDGVVASLRSRYTTLSNATADRMLSLYPESDFSSQYERAKTAFGDTVFTCQDWFLASRLKEAGVKHVYNYRFNTPDPVALASGPWQGVRHTSDLFFLFNGTNSGPYPNVTSVFTPFNATEAYFSAEVVGYWTSFARSFDPSAHPGHGTAPAWTDAASGRLVLQEGNATATVSHMERQMGDYIERCLFWNQFGWEVLL